MPISLSSRSMSQLVASDELHSMQAAGARSFSS